MHKCKLVTPRVVAMAMLLMGVSAWGIFASDRTSSGADSTTPPAASAAASSTSSSEQITLLKQQMVLQQKQIEQMQKALEEQKKLLEQLTKPSPANEQAAQPSQPAAGTEQAAQPHASSLGQVASTSPMIPLPQKKVENAAGPVAVTPTAIRMGSPAGAKGDDIRRLQIHIGDATLTPVGFMDFTSVLRNQDSGREHRDQLRKHSLRHRHGWPHPLSDQSDRVPPEHAELPDWLPRRCGRAGRARDRLHGSRLSGHTSQHQHCGDEQ